MLSSSLAAQAWAMRPGLIAGQYPERGDPEGGPGNRPLTALQGALAQLGAGRRSEFGDLVATVEKQGESMAALDRRQLEQGQVDLRRRFRTRGLRRSLCIRSFALIRETARRTIGLRHYDCQVTAAWAMLHGQLAEMETGEGKTLAATLAAATAALAGIPVHVVTVNDYLVERDAAAMAPLYGALGLTTGHVTQGMTPAQRRQSYASDITYCTNKQVVFDYLRDRLRSGHRRGRLRRQMDASAAGGDGGGQPLLRGLCFAIVDEADSALIDEARTPLILSRRIDNPTENAAYRQALNLAHRLMDGRDFFLDTARRKVHLTLAGQLRLGRSAVPATGLWGNARWREELVCQALHALHLLQKDHHYLVQESRVAIVDANTGRKMPDRSWERGLHQLVEVKEGCPVSATREVLGRTTYQRFFRRYLRLAGMTGTARETAFELRSVYGLKVCRIPLHRHCRRRELAPRVYRSAAAKWSAIIAATRALQARGRPVLIGTGSVADSEALSRRLAAAGIGHQVLNARQDLQEAQIVAVAGQPRQVTVATNMAGRGTDIPLGSGVARLGGLHVITACCNDSRRIDRQLAGRCARQGDPGSHQAILSIEDELVAQNAPPGLMRWLCQSRTTGGFVQRWLNLQFIRRAQRRVERRHREARRALLRNEHSTANLLAFSGHTE